MYFFEILLLWLIQFKISFLAHRLEESQEMLIKENIPESAFRSSLAMETAKKRAQILEGQEINVPEPSVLVNGAEADEDKEMDIDHDEDEDEVDELPSLQTSKKPKSSRASTTKKPAQKTPSSKSRSSLVQQPISSITPASSSSKKKLPPLATRR